MLDYGRKYDIEELALAIRNSKTIPERERFEKILDKILRETSETSETRSKLIMAVRNNDLRAIKRFNDELIHARALEDYWIAKERADKRRS